MKKYEEIFEDIKEKIVNHTYHTGAVLPTEKDLQEIYHVSRDTVRKALAILMQQGLIQKVQGKGSVVIDRGLLTLPVSGLTSYKELSNELHLNSKTIVDSLEQVTIDAQLAQLTGFSSGEEAWKIVRWRVIDNAIAVIDTDYLLCSIVPTMTSDIATDSIYYYLENIVQLDISYAQKEIKVVKTNQHEKELLQQDDYLVLIESRVFLSDTRQFQYTQSQHKLDKFRFVDFARRKNSI